MKPKSLKFLFPLLLMIVGLVWVGFSVFKYGLYNKAGPMSGFFPAMVGAAMFLFAFFDFFDVLKTKPGDVNLMMFMPIFSIVAIILCAYLIGTFPAMFIFLIV